MKHSNRLATSVALCAISFALPAVNAFAQGSTPAPAQNSGDQTYAIEDIIVTAQRREQRLQDVPLAISAFSVESLAAGKVESLINLDGRIPNVVLAPVGAFQFAGAFSIRGIGFADVESSFEPTVGVEVDGIYLSRNVGAVTDFFDVESVTVLRGPQGTLYGRNTIGGVVSVRTARPSGEFGVRAQATLGTNGRQELRAAVEAPIVDGILAAKVSGLIKSYDGFNNNDDGRDLGYQNVKSVRGTFALTPTDNFDATLIVDYTRDHGSGPALENASLPTMVLGFIGFPADKDGDPDLTHVGADIFSRLESYGATLEMNWDIGAVKLTSITGYRDTDTHSLSDFDGEQYAFLNVDRDEQHDQFSQEVRLSSDSDGPLTYVFGGYFMTQRYDIATMQYGEAFGGPTAGSTLFASQRARSKALFGQIDYEVLSGLTLTAGARYSDEYKRFKIQPLFFPTSQTSKASFDDFSPKFGISYAWTDQVMTYAQYSRGFRAGGFNGRAGSFAAVGPYDSESVDSYEIGFKSDFLNRAVTLNVSAFRSKYNDMQQSVQQIIPGTNINQTVVSNVGKSTIDGVEGEIIIRPASNFSLTGTVGYLDAGFDKFTADLGDGLGTIDRTNLPFTFAPKWSGSLTANFEQEIGNGLLTAQTTLRYASSLYTSFAPLNAVSDIARRSPSTIIDASIGYSFNDIWQIRLWGKNLNNEREMNNTFSVGNLLALRAYQPPREVGVDVSFKF